MADLKDEFFGISPLNQIVGFVQGGGDRFFEKDIKTCLNAVKGHPVMIAGGHDYGNGVNQRQKLPVIGKGAASAVGGHLCGLGRVDINHADELNSFQTRVFLGMKFSQIADTNDSTLDFLHLLTIC
jgi:hypothetical protein